MRMLAASAVAATLPTPSRNAPPPPPPPPRPPPGPPPAAPALPHERQLGFHLGVLRKSERHRRVDRAARGVESIGARPQPRSHVVAVAHEVLGEVDEQPFARGGGDREAPEDRSRERVTHGARFGGIGRQGTELIVRLHHEHLRSGAFELDDARPGQDAAIEPDVVRAEARGEPGRVEHFGVELRNLEPQPAGAFVPVEWEEAVDFLQACRSFVDRGDLIAARLSTSLGVRVLPAQSPKSTSRRSRSGRTGTVRLRTLNMRILPLPPEVYRVWQLCCVRTDVRRWVLFCPVPAGRPRRRRRVRRA